MPMGHPGPVNVNQSLGSSDVYVCLVKLMIANLWADACSACSFTMDDLRIDLPSFSTGQHCNWKNCNCPEKHLSLES